MIAIVHGYAQLSRGPGGYANNTKKYPVVYLMDSQWDFPLVELLYGQQYFDGLIPEIIIVHITLGGVNPNPGSLRARDYTLQQKAHCPKAAVQTNFFHL